MVVLKIANDHRYNSAASKYDGMADVRYDHCMFAPMMRHVNIGGYDEKKNFFQSKCKLAYVHFTVFGTGQGGK